jgi:predicted phage baseplate assembly protein
MVSLAAGTPMDLADDVAGRQFSIDDAVDVLPVHRVSVVGSPQVPDDQVDFVLERDGERVVDRSFSMLVVIRGVVPPEWDCLAHDVQPAATLEWVAVGPDGTEEPVAVTDGTGGLRRSGIVRLPWPTAWNRVGGQHCRLRATVVAGRYAEPVPLRSAHPNAVTARHKVSQRADLSDQLEALLALPDQVLRVDGSAGSLVDEPGAVELRLTDVDVDEQVWVSVESFVGVAPGDTVFVVDRDRGELQFGNGLAGRVPRATPRATAEVHYALGGGTAGNLGRGGSWTREGSPVVGTNSVAATGGVDAEPIELARQRAADELGRPDRTVTTDDAVDLAVTTPGVGVARAHASPGYHPGFPCVEIPSALTVTVVPEVDRDSDVAEWTLAPEPDGGLLSAVQRRLAAGRLLGQEVFVVPPRYRAVRIWLTITRSARDDAVGEEVVTELRRHLDPLRGGPEKAGWPFGAVIRPSELIGVAGRAVGVEATVTALSVALDDAEPTDCAELVIGPRDLVWLESAAITWISAQEDGGGLQ